LAHFGSLKKFLWGNFIFVETNFAKSQKMSQRYFGSFFGSLTDFFIPEGSTALQITKLHLLKKKWAINLKRIRRL